MIEESVIAASVALIAEFESFVDHIYLDSAGVETIGYGETDRQVIAAHRSLRMTEAEGRRLLVNRVAAVAADVRAMVKVELTNDQFVALTSLAYNIGSEGLRSSSAIVRINAGDYAGCAKAMKLWNKVNGSEVEGLTRRRAWEAALFLRQGVAPPIDQAPHPPDFTYIFEGEDWLWLGVERIHARCGSGTVLIALTESAELVSLGPKDPDFHVYLRGVAANARFTG